jgi:glycosyltransferase involved in cell wall biosynthesis
LETKKNFVSPSGVAHQTRIMIDGLLRSGKFKVLSLGGALKHDNYQPQKTEEWQDDWIIVPVDGYGSQDQIRAILHNEKPDIIWIMTDPRFWVWFWEIEQEIRQHVPIVYYHVWDNLPYPHFNKPYYESNDLVATISKVSQDIVKTVAPTVKSFYLPHTVNTDLFKKHSKSDVEDFKKTTFSQNKNIKLDDKMIFFWNNRNARRKQSGTLIYWFKEFLDFVGHDKAMLIMHTDPKDSHGQDLEAIVNQLNLTDGQIVFSREKMPENTLSFVYNICDCTINISDAEGFGLSTLESLACEVPVIVNMTGGLQEQVTNSKDWFGFGIEPASKAIIGSQDVPYIYEDRLNKEEFLQAIIKFYNLTDEERKEMGKKGRQHVNENYNFQAYKEKWVETLLNVHEEGGSWETRNYKPWMLMEVL